MNFKKIQKQVNGFVLKLPLALCQVKPENISLKEVACIQQVISKSVNILENVNNVLNVLLEEGHYLLNQINEYEGDQGVPTIRHQINTESQNTNENSLTKNTSEIYCNESRAISSVKEHNFVNTPKLRCTNKDIEVKKITVDRSTLPTDAIFKWYKTYTIQDIKFYLWNTLYQLEQYYYPSQCKLYIIQTPVEVKGSAFGIDTKILIITSHHHVNISQPSIYNFLRLTISLQLFPGTILDNLYKLEQEKQEIDGLAVSTYIQMYDTSARVNGVSYYSHILCSDSFMSYFTKKNKYKFNDNTFEILSYISVSNRFAVKVQLTMSTEEIKGIIWSNLGNKNSHIHKQIIENNTIVFYQQSQNAAKILVGDEVPQVKLITKILTLCWVYVSIHFNKLNPILAEFICKFVAYYHKLLNYQDKPDQYLQLVGWIDEIFATQTGFDELEERIPKTIILK